MSEQTARERLKVAIDNMEKTETCLDVFDRAIAQARREEREAVCQVIDMFKLPIGSDHTQDWSGLERWNASLDKISQAIRQREGA